MNEHKPVMVKEVLRALRLTDETMKNDAMRSESIKSEIMNNEILKNEVLFVDATFGRGGHSLAILNHMGTSGKLLAIDRDPDAFPYADAIAKNDSRFFFRQGNFSELYKFCQSMDLIGKVDGILIDLGVSSPQLDNPERGFSFLQEGPLDMRMNPNSGISAKEWVNSADESEIDDVLNQYGEERFHRRIAHAIVMARTNEPIQTTKQLASIIAKANPAWERYKHPATRSFQAIRIFINHEFDELNAVLEQSLKILRVGGRLIVISFHSLEDRIVKRFIQKHERGVDSHSIESHYIPKGLPIYEQELKKTLRRVDGIHKPSDSEIESNVRARSAVLRVAEKIGEIL